MNKENMDIFERIGITEHEVLFCVGYPFNPKWASRKTHYRISPKASKELRKYDRLCTLSERTEKICGVYFELNVKKDNLYIHPIPDYISEKSLIKDRKWTEEDILRYTIVPDKVDKGRRFYHLHRIERLENSNKGFRRMLMQRRTDKEVMLGSIRISDIHLRMFREYVERRIKEVEDGRFLINPEEAKECLNDPLVKAYQEKGIGVYECLMDVYREEHQGYRAVYTSVMNGIHHEIDHIPSPLIGQWILESAKRIREKFNKDFQERCPREYFIVKQI